MGQTALRFIFRWRNIYGVETTYQLADLYDALNEMGDADTLTLPGEAVDLLNDLAELIALQLASRVCIMGAEPFTPTITAGVAFHAVALAGRFESVTLAAYKAAELIEQHPAILNLPDPFPTDTDSQAA